ERPEDERRRGVAVPHRDADRPPGRGAPAVKLKVVHTFGRNAGLVQTMGQPVVRFGRAPENDVVFDPEYDRDASGHPAEARLEGDRWVIVDLKSRNGTFVGGRRVELHALKAGDEVTFGTKGPRVRIDFEDGPLVAPAGASGTVPAAPPGVSVAKPAAK